MPPDRPSRSPTLPAWYHRLLDKDTVKPEDFDEDLSEQDSDASSDDEDGSHKGSEYDYYYELKLKREDRKEELESKARLKRKEKARRVEVQVSNRVKEIFNKIKKDEAENPKKNYEKEDMFVRGKVFGLYSADFVLPSGASTDQSSEGNQNSQNSVARKLFSAYNNISTVLFGTIAGPLTRNTTPEEV